MGFVEIESIFISIDLYILQIILLFSINFIFHTKRENSVDSILISHANHIIFPFLSSIGILVKDIDHSAFCRISKKILEHFLV